jgi:membrane protein YqaA with SNARE-associated domain
VALSVLSNPGKWRRLALYSGLGSLVGAFCLYLILLQFGKSPLDQLAGLGVPGTFEGINAMGTSAPDLESGLAAVGTVPPKWELARAFFDKYGLYSLALGSLVPFMSWPPVVMAGLSSDRWFMVLLLLAVGRLLRYFILCFGVREGWAMFQTLREQAKEKKEAKAHHDKG